MPGAHSWRVLINSNLAGATVWSLLLIINFPICWRIISGWYGKLCCQLHALALRPHEHGHEFESDSAKVFARVPVQRLRVSSAPSLPRFRQGVLVKLSQLRSLSVQNECFLPSHPSSVKLTCFDIISIPRFEHFHHIRIEACCYSIQCGC